MNRILSVNIGGMIFQLDEEAFEILKTYLDSIRLHFSRTEGSHEIISDIEARIGEMLQSKLHPAKQAVNKADVESIILAMGKPEDFGDAETGEEQSRTSSAYQDVNEPTFKTTKKRLFRDPDNGVIGGVCSGLAAYLGTEAIWIRLIFLIVFFTFGTGLLIYIILWIIMPKAKTITDKLEMRGENITISNIERSVKEELNDLKKNFNSFSSSPAATEMRTRANDFGNLLAQIIRYAAKFLVKFIGVIFIVFGIIFLATLILLYFGFIPPFSEFPMMVFPEKWQHILAGTGILLLVGLPLLFLVILGFKVVFNIRQHNRPLMYSMLGIWMLSFLMVAVSGGMFIKNFATVSVQKEKLNLSPIYSDTILLSTLKTPENESGDYSYRFGFGGKIVLSEEEFLSENVNLDIEKSESGELELIKTVTARGKSYTDAKNNGNNISYSFSQDGNNILFGRYYKTNVYQPWRHQEIKLLLRVPEGKVIKILPGMKDFLYDVDNVTNTYDEEMVGQSWLMTKDGLKCIDCDFDTKKKEWGSEGNEPETEDNLDIRIDEDGIRIESEKNKENEIKEKFKGKKPKVQIKIS